MKAQSEKQTYSSNFSLPQQQMELIGQIHDLATFTLGGKALVSTEYEAG
jgi:hypothetical protein